ncbi:MAG: hypothetical protein U9N13_02540 [Euryarchaeota archaeon]|nr:hypothetical protein [Euryarchaeota archaeon]
MRHDRFSDSNRLKEKHVIDPYHIDEFNEAIARTAALKDKGKQISKGIDRVTPKVCNTALRLAKEDNDIPLNHIDQAIALNIADPSLVEHDLSKVIAEKLNLSHAFRYPETFGFDSNRKKELSPRNMPKEKKLSINIHYVIEALYEQVVSADRWYVVLNRKWYEMSTEPRYELVPERLPSGTKYSCDDGVINVTELFDVDAIKREWNGPINIFDNQCVDVIMKHPRRRIACEDENGVMHEYEIDWSTSDHIR